MDNSKLLIGLYYLIALLISFTIHEFAHALAALRAGDDTAKRKGRLSLNPIDHLDPIGAIFLVIMAFMGFGIAWGKPVPINPGNFKNPKRDEIIVSLAGIFFNLCLATIAGLTFRYFNGIVPKSTAAFFLILTNVNVWLAVFNLIPIPPLDGSHVLMNLMPYKSARAYADFMARYGLFVFFGFLLVLMNTNILGSIIVFLVELIIGAKLN